jgi:hypothetical protein
MIWIEVCVKTLLGFEAGEMLVFSSISSSLIFAGASVSKSSKQIKGLIPASTENCTFNSIIVAQSLRLISACNTLIFGKYFGSLCKPIEKARRTRQPVDIQTRSSTTKRL